MTSLCCLTCQHTSFAQISFICQGGCQPRQLWVGWATLWDSYFHTAHFVLCLVVYHVPDSRSDTEDVWAALGVVVGLAKVAQPSTGKATLAPLGGYLVLGLPTAIWVNDGCFTR